MSVELSADITKCRTRAKPLFRHAAGCKKKLDDCASCKAGMQWFAELPLQTLSAVLEERNGYVTPLQRARMEDV